MKNGKSLGENIEFVITMRWFAPILVLFGLVGFTLVQYVFNPVSAINMSNELRVSLDVIKLLSGTLISTGLISLFLRISSVKNDTENTVKTIFKDFMNKVLKLDFPLDGYNTRDLDNIKKRIVLHVSQNNTMDINMLNDSVYSLEKSLINLTKTLYWDYHERTTIIIPDSKRGVFKKKILTEYKIVNLYELKNTILFALSFIKDTNTDDVKINKFQINNTDLSLQIDEFTKIENITESDYSLYSKNLIFERELDKCKEHIVKLVYEYTVPISDLNSIYRLSKPCKKLNHNVILDGEEYSNWELSVNAFSSWFCDNSELAKDYQVRTPTSQNAQINFNNWTLPGTGYMIGLKPKVNS